MMRQDKDVLAWKKANPYVLVNVSSRGTACGRVASIEDAVKVICERGDRYIATEGFSVLFDGRVIL